MREAARGEFMKRSRKLLALVALTLGLMLMRKRRARNSDTEPTDA